jgi:hypothetical protein
MARKPTPKAPIRKAAARKAAPRRRPVNDVGLRVQALQFAIGVSGLTYITTYSNSALGGQGSFGGGTPARQPVYEPPATIVKTAEAFLDFLTN